LKIDFIFLDNNRCSGVVVSALASINEVNQRHAQLVFGMWPATQVSSAFPSLCR